MSIYSGFTGTEDDGCASGAPMPRRGSSDGKVVVSLAGVSPEKIIVHSGLSSLRWTGKINAIIKDESSISSAQARMEC